MANSNVASDLAQVNRFDCQSFPHQSSSYFFSKLNNKLDELAALNESDYESTKAANLFQYFDKIYTSSYGTTQFHVLIDTLISKQYTSKNNHDDDDDGGDFFALLCRTLLSDFETNSW